jgi:hypothetical protein
VSPGRAYPRNHPNSAFWRPARAGRRLRFRASSEDEQAVFRTLKASFPPIASCFRVIEAVFGTIYRNSGIMTVMGSPVSRFTGLQFYFCGLLNDCTPILELIPKAGSRPRSSQVHPGKLAFPPAGGYRTGMTPASGTTSSGSTDRAVREPSSTTAAARLARRLGGMLLPGRHPGHSGLPGRARLDP